MNPVEQRILYLIDLFILWKRVKSKTDFCSRIGMRKQGLNSIERGRQYFTVKHIEAICREFDINANWIFARSNKLYNNTDTTEIADIPAHYIAGNAAGSEKPKKVNI